MSADLLTPPPCSCSVHRMLCDLCGGGRVRVERIHWYFAKGVVTMPCTSLLRGVALLLLLLDAAMN
eukprot:6189744-Pleurochrysis_carterae.AAC.1